MAPRISGSVPAHGGNGFTWGRDDHYRAYDSRPSDNRPSDTARSLEQTFAHMVSSRETAAVIALVRRRRPPTTLVADLIEQAGSALEVLADAEGQTSPQLFALNGDTIDSELSAIEAEIAAWRQEGFAVLTVLDADYPENLRSVHDRPPLLFVQGKVCERDERSVAIVGTRRATEEGLRTAEVFAGHLSQAGYVIVSGLAAGIDTAAHSAALAANGRTVAVIGTGLHHVFPKENADLQRRLALESAVISQFWPDQGPRKHTFPLRNRVMSGLSRATVVIEASYTSGARMQARLALEHGRPVFLLDSLLKHEWARSYAARPGTYVVSHPDQVLSVLDRLYSTEVSLSL